MTSSANLPKFFRAQQRFPRPHVTELQASVQHQLEKVCTSTALENQSVAITVGSRGVANIAEITRACVNYFKSRRALPFIIPAMGSHGGATADGQKQVLESLGVTSAQMGCPIRSSMKVGKVCDAPEGFPVYIDQHALNADHVLVVNRIKPHTRFAGEIESGLMKMMLIGLGKQQGAEVYHRAIVNHSFDQIVRSVAQEVIGRCNVLAGLAILENAYEETAQLVGVPAQEIESVEPGLLHQVKQWMPQLPFDRAEFLVVDQIGKNVSGTGMDTNVIGRKKNDHAAIDGEKPNLHHIYVRSLTTATHGNAAGIGLAELCHARVLEQMDYEATRTNCITAGHVTGAMLPIDFPNDRQALETVCQLAGYVPPQAIEAMWILDTLHLDQVECSEAFFARARQSDSIEVVRPPTELEFDSQGNLRSRF